MRNLILKLRPFVWLGFWIVASWFLVHVAAFLGVFVAFAYPIWWFIVPEKTTCLLCRVGREGGRCRFCRRLVSKDGTSPKDFTSVFLNALIILLISVISAGLVYIESFALKNAGFPPTPKTVSFFIPTKGQYRLGEIFPMKIEINNIKVPINAVQADIGFDSERVEIVDISTQDSFATIFIQKEINNQAGWARLTGGLPNPGYFSDHGIFGTVYFKAKMPGLTKVEFLNSSMVLANDNKGSDVLKEFPEASYLILPEKISKDEEDEQLLLISETDVLGESTDVTQMKFYEEVPVLGFSIDSEEGGVEKEWNLWQKLADMLQHYDNFVLKQWEKIFRR